MPGPIGKDPRLRQRRNRATTRAVLRSAVTLAEGEVPPLPRPLRGRRGWHSDVRTWWRRAWASMPPRIAEVDVSGLELVAVLRQLLAEMLASGTSDPANTVTLAAEIRQQERRHGLDEISGRALQRLPPPPAPRPPGGRPRSGRDPRDVLRIIEGGRPGAPAS